MQLVGGTPRNLRAVAIALVDAMRSNRCLTKEAASAMVAKRVGGIGEKEDRNVRRRLYDALKVLVAVGVVTKSDSTLRWRGVAHLRPAGTRLARKRAVIAALAARIALAERNRTSSATLNADAVQLPFVLVRVAAGATLTCDEDPHTGRVCIQLDSFFQILNDSAVVALVAALPPPALPRARRFYAPPALTFPFDILQPQPILTPFNQPTVQEAPVHLSIDTHHHNVHPFDPFHLLPANVETHPHVKYDPKAEPEPEPHALADLLAIDNATSGEACKDEEAFPRLSEDGEFTFSLPL